MANYKVIQDIEAEDKLLGPFTLRQFVYASVVMVMGFVAFKLAAVSPLFIIPFIIPMGFFALLAAPFGHDQSSEVWLLAKIGFMLKPRRRIWDQTGMRELVSITVPKKVEEHLTDGLTQIEVKSRLQALANTIDSRGWAVKNVNVNMYNEPSYAAGVYAPSDRLVDSTSLPQSVPTTEVLAADDILDETSNPTAQHLDAMISQAEQAHRKTMVATVQNGQAPMATAQDNWYMGQAPQQTAQSQATDVAEQQLLDQIHLENTKPNPAYGHMRVLDPSGKASPKKHHAKKPKHQQDDKRQTTSSSDPNPAIMRLASNDDLNVATIAREADKATKQLPDDEVVISLR